MARFNKIQTLQAIIQTGMVPVYYNKEVEIAKQVVKACYEGGVRAFEFSPTRYLASWLNTPPRNVRN